MFKYLICLTLSVYGFTEISSVESNSIVNEFNNLRSSIPASYMFKVSWNFDLQHALNTYTTNIDPYWYFNKSISPFVNYNIVNLMEIPEFSMYKKLGWRSLFHDTCADTNTAVKRIINFRIRQQSCFDYALCNSTTYNKYESCSKLPLSIVKQNSNRCSWFYGYYPKMIWPDIYQISCFLTGIPGPNTPTNQPNSFGCFARDYFKYDPSNDLPYVQGIRCSKCPNNLPCEKNLCLV